MLRSNARSDRLRAPAQQLAGEKVGAVPAVWQRPIVVNGLPRPVTATAKGGPTWGMFALGLATGALLVLVTAATAIVVARAAMRPVSFAHPGPMTLKGKIGSTIANSR